MTDDSGYKPPEGGRKTSKKPGAGTADVAARSREIALRLPTVGCVTWLCIHSPVHRQLFVQDLEWRVLPPVILGQYKLVVDSKVGGLPTAYVSWAFLSAEAERTYRETHRLRPDDWRSGDNLWLVDFVTPFGGAAALLEDLYYQVHKNRDIKLIYPVGDGEPGEVTLSQLIRDQRESDTPGGRLSSVTSSRH